MRRHAVPLLAVAFLAAACSGPTTTATPTTNDMADMPGMAAAAPPAQPRQATPDGTGLSATVNGYTLVLSPDALSFHINGPGGRAVTRYQPYESELMQLEVVRSDLTGYRHVDMAMRQDGTWVAALPTPAPGSYRAYATFAAPDASAGTPQVYQLSRPFTVPGTGSDTPLPAATASTTVGGYQVTVTGRASADVPTTLHIAVTKDGKPLPYFQRYLDGYAHVTAFHAGDLAFAHCTPATGQAGQLGTQAVFPESGTWRLFVTFQTTGAPLTAAFTVAVS